MAGEQPKSSPPGAFPGTPAADDDQSFSVNPIPASSGGSNPIQLAPGEKVPDPSTINDNTVSSTVRDDPELKSRDQEGQQTVSVAPIPASGGIGNPIQLKPGETVPDPSTITGNTVESTATTDKASYEKAATGASVVPPASSSQTPDTSSTAVFGGPGPVIPESGMAMGKSSDINQENTGPTMSSVAPGSTTSDLAGQQPKETRGIPQVVRDSQQESARPTISSVAPGTTTSEMAGEQPKETRGVPEVISKDDQDSSGPTISSVAPGSTTNQMAGQQPKETRGVPEIVSESQKEANVDPEASANPEAVEEKKEVEQSFMNKVSEEPSTSESGALGKSEDGVGAKAAAGVAAGGAAVAGGAIAANEMIRDKTGTDPKSSMPQPVQDTVDEKAKESSIPEKATGESTAERETTDTVPEEVTASQKEAGEDAEAAGNAEAVREKSAMEQELLSKVPSSDAKGEPAPTESAATATSAPGATTSDSGAPQLSDPVGGGLAPISMDDKPAQSDGLNASKDDAAAPPTESKAAEQSKPMDDSDISPMSKQAGSTDPQVTSGTETAATPRKNGPSSSTQEKRGSFIDKLKGTPESSKASATSGTPSASDSKKEKRRSFFGKIKDKLKQ